MNEYTFERHTNQKSTIYNILFGHIYFAKKIKFQMLKQNNK